jgi:integrase
VRDGRRRARSGQPAAEQAGSSTQDETFPAALTIHDLRHTAASLAISAGANVKAVQRMLGHASAAMTLDTYADLFDDDLDAVSAALDDARRAATEVEVKSQSAPGRARVLPDPHHSGRFEL